MLYFNEIGGYMEKEQEINRLFEEIEKIDNKKENLIDELVKNQKVLSQMSSDRNLKCIIFAFITLFLSIVSMVISQLPFLGLGVFLIGAITTMAIDSVLMRKEKPVRKKINDINNNIKDVNEEKAEMQRNLSKYVTKDNKEELIDSIDKRLNEIRQEKNELKNIRSLMDEEASLIDITTVYIVEIDNIKYLAYLEKPLSKVCLFKDIFSNEDIWKGIGSNLDEALNRSHSKPTSVARLKDVEPVVLAYPNNLVPDYVLKQIYYSLNNVDLNNPILKKAQR